MAPPDPVPVAGAPRIDGEECVRQLAEALAERGIALPSLGGEQPLLYGFNSAPLIDLGSCDLDTARALIDILTGRDGGAGESASVPTVADTAMAARDWLRAVLAAHGLSVPVNVEPIQGQRRIVLGGLSLDDVRKLAAVLDANRPAENRNTGVEAGAVMWCATVRLAGEVVHHNQRAGIRLRALANDQEWTALPASLRPARLVEIDAARRARKSLGQRAGAR